MKRFLFRVREVHSTYGGTLFYVEELTWRGYWFFKWEYVLGFSDKDLAELHKKFLINRR